MNDIDEFFRQSYGIDDLEHHGVKGMHWGVHRSPKTPARTSSDRKKVDKTLEKLSTHGKPSLTNKELGDLNKRLQLEKSLKDLTTVKKNKSVIKKGHSAVKELLGVGTTLAAVLTFSKTPQGKAIITSLGLDRPPGLHYKP